MAQPARAQISIDKVTLLDLSELLPLVRAYCDFYEVSPRDEKLVGLSRALIEDPAEGMQLIARDEGDRAVGFATIFWGWQTLDAGRIGLMNDLFVVPDLRGGGVGRALIEACRGQCRKKGVGKLVWETAPDNKTAQRLYDSTGAESSTWLAYELEAW
jgi:GNAT superfamily N-acetyltransferase